MPLSVFHPIISNWFKERFGSPTDVQCASWPAIGSGKHALIAAPTGSGKTLAAFLTCLDSLVKQASNHDLPEQTQVLYISPLKALSNDVQKNLRQPLAEISVRTLEAGLLLPELRVEVRTGDTPAKNRQELLKHPPHILVTTPESLYLLLTARKSREILRTVRTVIVDEIHALAGNKRGSHLTLSLERLDTLTATKANRIGLSATQKPLEEMAQFLVGGVAPRSQSAETTWTPHPCHIVNMGQRRDMNLAVETPKDELGAIATNAIWTDVYDRLTELVEEHRSTLVFVNTRRLAERIAHHLSERLGGEAVATHHGSLSRRMRLSAEERLKQGHTRVVIATASLELGIDIGFVDLVCQIGSPRAIATCLQRIGRAGHWVGATPKGRLFCTTRDELVECAALIHAIQEGHLDRIIFPSAPMDILAQQLVAEIAAQEWKVDDLFCLCAQSYPYRNLTRTRFDEIITMLAHGFIPNRGRQQAYVFHDQVQHVVRPRRGARLAALTSGGAIPDSATYAVMAEPQGTIIGSVDEDFAVESMAGDIVLLGNTSWRIRGVETGVMRVEDAQGAPPTIPFWRGEAPARTSELSEEVATLRQELINHSEYPENGIGTLPANGNETQDKAIFWLKTHCGLDRRAAEQALAYQLLGHQMIGDIPTQQTIIAERFFDEAGGMQLVIHAPFGGRLTRAWGLALRKRFCVSFDFELQAAATDEGLVLSLGEKHSFPLETVFSMLRSNTVRDVLTQAVLQSSMFIARWRWNASRALALLRFRNGKRVPLYLQRMRAEDLLTAIFPMATACQDNRPPGNIEVPNHPLVQETVRDCLEEAMDVDGLTALLKQIEKGQVRCVAVETPIPSVFSHEILNANPYAFLDDAPLEERRARAVNMRQMLPPEEAAGIGALDLQAIATVCDEAWPLVRNADELHDALHMLIMIPEREGADWASFLSELLATKRAVVLTIPDHSQEELRWLTAWIAHEYLPLFQVTFPDLSISAEINDAVGAEEKRQFADGQEFCFAIIRSWMEIVGPTTAKELAEKLGLSPSAAYTSLIQLEAEGQVLQGTFRPNRAMAEVEWCHRRLLARIHRHTVTSLRREIEAVPASTFMRFLFRWQHVAPTSRLHGENGTLEIIQQLAGFEAAATAWEPFLLKGRIANYTPDKLDYLCLRGAATWGRLTPPTGAVNERGIRRKSRIIPTSLAPISVFPREDADWLLTLSRVDAPLTQAILPEKVSSVAQAVYHHLHQHGASFFADLTRGTNHLQAEIEQALWELTSVGLVTADGFDNLRALLDPKRRRGIGRHHERRPRHTIGRWCLLPHHNNHAIPLQEPTRDPIDAWARQLLTRYGIVFRDLLKRESLPFAWRDLLTNYRRLELRGEIRGGRFVAGFTGDQFGLPEAVEALRSIRKDIHAGGERIQLAGSDPLNLVGIILPGNRIPAVPSQQIIFENGVPVPAPRYSAALA